MRELKFRAWDGQRMAYFDMYGLLDYCSLHSIVGNLNPSKRGGMPSLLFEDCEPFMEFTGLSDKNGKEIYEGDIVYNGLGNPKFCKIGEYKIKQFMNGDLSASRSHYGVYFYSDAYTAELSDGQTIHYSKETIVLHENHRIIGNIHETPKLAIDINDIEK